MFRDIPKENIGLVYRLMCVRSQELQPTSEQVRTISGVDFGPPRRGCQLCGARLSADITPNSAQYCTVLYQQQRAAL